MKNKGVYKRLVLLLAVLSLVAAACGSDDDTADTTAAAEAITIGYISGGEASPFVAQVSSNIRVVAARLGVELVECDTEFLAEKGVECGLTIAAANPGAVINWQFHPTASEAVCDSYDNKPTVTLDTPNEPCAVVFVGADNLAAGILAGTFMAEAAQADLDCEYDLFIAVELPTLPDVNLNRAGGTRTGFEDICGAIPAAKYALLDKTLGGDDALENIRRLTTDILTANPDARTILASSPFSDGDGVSLINAVDAAGRGDDLVILVAHGADEIGHEFIRNDARWIGSVAYFPERYGELAVPAAIALAKGETVDAEILTTHEMVTPDNIEGIYPAAG